MKNRYLPWVISLLFLMMVSCNRQCAWVLQDVTSDLPQFDSCQLTSVPADSLQALEIQLLRGTFGIIAFLNVYCGKLESPYFSLYINKNPYHFRGYIMTGYQRLQLPNDATAILLSALNNDGEITIVCGNYSATLPTLPRHLLKQLCTKKVFKCALRKN